MRLIMFPKTYSPLKGMSNQTLWSCKRKKKISKCVCVCSFKEGVVKMQLFADFYLMNILRQFESKMTLILPLQPIAVPLLMMEIKKMKD